MSGNRTTCWSSLLRLSLVCGTALAIAGLCLFGPASQAETAVLSAKSAAAFQTPKKLLVSIPLTNLDGKTLEGQLHVELLGPGSKLIAQADKHVRQSALAASYRFEWSSPKVPAERVTVRCRFGKKKMAVPLSRILLAKAHETSLVSGQEFFAGSTGTIRCEVHGVKSIAENVPLPGAEVVVQLRQPDGKVLPLLKGRTGADGLVNGQFQVPQVSAGTYKLQVVTLSSLGQEKLERDIRIRADSKILLVSDKPLYQPGQLMHLRALALQAFDLKPAAGRELVFEVEDSKGNKVFKRQVKTSAYGIAAVDFQLADEVNMGNYRIRAILGQQQADKTVAVKKYVLPKFKVELTTDKRFYLPKETLHADLQSDYFFGKPVANGKIKVTASTFDVQFRPFQTWDGTTDANGHAKFNIHLPDYFVGQPLQKGNALVKLEVKLTDTADHTETINRTYPVSDQPIRVSLLPEGGRLVPNMDNRVFAAAIYPDGSPAACTVNLWLGRQAKGKPLTTVHTNAAGLAEFHVRPKPEQIRLDQSRWEQRHIEMLGGQRPAGWGPRLLFDLFAEAKDKKGNSAHVLSEVNSEPLGENILLRLNQAIYKAGDSLKVDIRTSAGLPTAYLDLVRSGQTLLSRWLDVKDGKASYTLDLPAEIFGTVEVHAYQMLSSGEIIRDSRVIYVQPRNDLKITVKADKDIYKPGETGHIRFQVTNAAGQPAAAALGILIVDEAVYALQEMQPGLEKVYFTLQKELLKPQAQAVYRPAESIPVLIQRPELTADKQQIAQALLSGVKPKPPARWEVAPALERRQQVEAQVRQIGMAVHYYAANRPDSYMKYDKKSKRWVFKDDLLDEAVKSLRWDAKILAGPFGKKWTLSDLARLEKGFTVDHLAEAETWAHMRQLVWSIVNYSQANQARWFKNGKWNFPPTILADAVKHQRLDTKWLKDAWGRTIKLMQHKKKIANRTGWHQFDYYELVSAGPDGKFGTKDDIKQSEAGLFTAYFWYYGDWLWFDVKKRDELADFQAMSRDRLARRAALLLQGGDLGGGFGAIGGGFVADGAFMRKALPEAALSREVAKGAGQGLAGADQDKAQGGSAQPARIREYFPETMFWQPALITDENGRADLAVPFADSITTWRLSASASSQSGALGGMSAPLRVFQDFFVDLDLPISLTQNDEVAFPVAVYNYLKSPQIVKLELKREPWFELMDAEGGTRSLDLKPNEVTAVKFRIKARRIGFHPLTVKATGAKLSDAIKRTIEIVPDGQKVERVVTDRLSGRISQTIDIPQDALPDSSRLLVKVYPGIMSQVLEGTEGLLRLPGG